MSPYLLITSTAVGLGVIFILGCTLVLDKTSTLASLLLDYSATSVDNYRYYPFTVQNVMWLVFFFSLGELFWRFLVTRADENQLRQHYLPENARAVLQAADLGEIYKKIRETVGDTELFLPRLINRIILQFHSSRSVGQANALLDSSLDLYMHEVDLRYNLLRYLMWLIPSLGFIGTVIGIAMALNYAGSADPNAADYIKQIAANLAVAFFTTLLALLQAMILVFLLHIVQAREERALNHAGQYCLDNLINRLYTP